MKKTTFSLSLLLMPALLLAGNPVKTSLGFMENKGQIAFTDGKVATEVLFKTTGTGPGIFITTSGITYVFYEKEGASGTESPGKLNWSKIEMFLKDANIKPENISTEKELPGLANFYLAHCPNGVLSVKTWQKVTIAEVYPGIDWVLNADDAKGLSYDFIVHPGADPSRIKAVYKGASSISLREANTQLILRSRYGEICEGALNVFEKGGKKLDATFKLKGKELSYSIAGHDPAYELIIDPPLQWSQKQVSSGIDYGNALVAPRDGTGDVVITGFSGATDFPTLNAYQGTNAGNDDIVVLRLNTSGTVLWSTYYGGSGSEMGKGVGADVNGNCYVAGSTNSPDFPTLNPLYSAFQGGTSDMAILKLNNAGTRQWATYYGHLQNDYGNAIVCDVAGNCYITGYTNSPNFPLLNAVYPVKNLVIDAFVMKLDASCVLQWATFIGSDDEDRGRGIALDVTATNVFVAGTTMGNTFPVTSGVFDPFAADPYSTEDAFVVKMAASGGAVQYATLLGGFGTDIPEDIAVDNSGNAYVTGYTFCSDFPVANPGGGAFVDSTIGSIATHDGFITKLNSTGTAALWSTYLGGSGVDMGLGICYDPFFGIYLTGATASTDFPVALPPDNVFYQGVQGDGGNFYDFFIAWFNIAGVMQWSTYYGDGMSNEGRGIDTDAQSNIFVCGADSNNVRVMKFAPYAATGVLVSGPAIQLHAFPVPVQGLLNVEMQMEKGGYVKAEILNLEGKTLKKEFFETVGGKNTLQIDVSQLPEGAYLLRIEDAEKVSAVKFTKTR